MTVNQKIAWSILAAIGVLGLLTLIAAYLMIGIAWQDFQRSTARRDQTGPLPTGSTLIRYALARKCPLCGRGKISSSVFQMNSACPVCGVVFWKNEGEWIGPAVINYSVALAGALAGAFDCFCVVLRGTWIPSFSQILAEPPCPGSNRAMVGKGGARPFSLAQSNHDV